ARRAARQEVALNDRYHEAKEPTRRAWALSLPSLCLTRRGAHGLLGERRLDRDRRAAGTRRLHPATQHLGNAPRLSDTPPRRVRLHCVEDLADGAEAKIVERADAAVEETPRPGGVVRVYFEPCVDPWTYEPRPRRALMIS